jgi:hypothetical protein
MLIVASCLLLGAFHVPRGFVKRITDDRMFQLLRA